GRRLCGFPLCFFPVAAAGKNVFARHSLHIFEGQRNVATPAHAARLFDSAYLSNCGSTLSDDHVAVHYDVSEYLHLNVVTNMGRLTGNLVHSSTSNRSVRRNLEKSCGTARLVFRERERNQHQSRNDDENALHTLSFRPGWN